MGRRLGIGRLAVVAGVAWMVVSLVVGEHGFLTVRSLKAEHQRLEEEIATLETELDRISTRLRETSADPYELETIAREEYGLSQPGETVYRIEDGQVVPPEAPPSPPDASSAAGVDTDTGGR
jgi:cell division protein FtsB